MAEGNPIIKCLRFLGGLAVIGILAVGCARSRIREARQAMRPIQLERAGHLEQGDRGSLVKALREQLEFWEKKRLVKGGGNGDLVFGSQRVSRQAYSQALRGLVTFLETQPSPEDLDTYLKQYFYFFQIYGGKRWGEVLVTSYYEPVIKGFKKPTEKYSQPLYRIPKDMVIVKLGKFAEVLPSLEDLRVHLKEQNSLSKILYGRMIPSEEEGRPAFVVPFPDRATIDGQKALADQNLEICYVDPIEAFFLQIQGSGRVELEDGGSIHLTYAAQNGHPYYAIGRELLETIPKEEMSLQKIEAFLRTLPKEKQEEILYKNASYVFFQEAPSGRGLTYQGTQVVSGRTIATDKSLFPKGALALLELEIPVFKTEEQNVPTLWEKHSRLVLDQDTGGAIRGPGRVDYFWGFGKKAAQAAGVMKNLGQLHYLVPKLDQSE